MPKLRVFVTGATGKQGGAVAKLLLERGHQVVALTRRPESPEATALAQNGARIVKGSLEDEPLLEKTLRDVDAVFAMSTPFEAGMDAEVKQGRSIADAAKRAGVRHLVYTSVGSADRNTGIPHFETKWQVEQYIRSLEVPHTITAPVYFMENIFAPWMLPALQAGKYATPLPPDLELAQIALADLAQFNVLVMENRDRFLGKRIDIASDVLRGNEAAEIVSDIVKRKIEYYQVPMDQVRAISEDYAIMFEWFIKHGYSVDTVALRRDYPEVQWHTFRAWAQSQDWSMLEAGTPA